MADKVTHCDFWNLQPTAPKSYQFTTHAKENILFQIEILQSAMSTHDFPSLAKNCPLLQLLDMSSNFHAHAYKVAIHFTDYG